MKRILLPFMLMLSITAFAQQKNSFKNLSKNKVGTTPVNIKFSNSVGKTINKGTFKYSQNVSLPASFLIDTLNDVKYDDGKLIYIKSKRSNLVLGKNSSPMDEFYAFFNSIKKTTNIENPKEELVISKQTVDKYGITHIRLNQFYKGIKVYGTDSYLHINSNENIFNGRIIAFKEDISITPKISKYEAIELVKKNLSTKSSIIEFPSSIKKHMHEEIISSELVIYKNTLVYKISIIPNFTENWEYFINSNTGNIIKSVNKSNQDTPVTAIAEDINGVSRTINTTYSVDDNTYVLANTSEQMFDESNGTGIIITYNANNTQNKNITNFVSSDNTWSDPTSVSVHYNVELVYEYFKNTFDRSSFDDNGSNIMSIVNVTNPDGSQMDNAYWNGRFMSFGNGADLFTPLAGALDVVGHEFGHAVVSKTANLRYEGQSGAINESYADIFGCMIDRDDWTMGEAIMDVSTYFPSGVLRDMSNPHNMSSEGQSGWQPMHTSEMYIGEGDHGGVHTNSGIGNYAFYLYATSLSRETAEKVFYNALTNYLTADSQFIDFRIAVIQSASDIYGSESNEVVQARIAFSEVGIYDEESVDNTTDYPTNPGDEHMLIVNDDYINDNNSLYTVDKNTLTLESLSQTILKRKPSVTDDGTIVVFISDDSKIRAISTDPTDPNEMIISDEAFWDNVAISKDGNRIACVSNEVDHSIYIYDFNLSEWKIFELYNPTTSQEGSNSAGVKYADAIEFDHTGEYVLYDSFNSYTSTSGEDINYWDIGIIKVWDNQMDNFSDGEISKPLGNLPEGVSIGNPTFSKNSPYIIAFDAVNDNTGEYVIVGANLKTNEGLLILENNTLGFPSYSSDDSELAYSTINSDLKSTVNIVSLEANKITSTGTPVTIFTDAKWPVMYAQGIRSLQLAPIANFSADYIEGEAPFSIKFKDLSYNNPVSWNWTFEGGTPSTSTEQNPNITYNNTGIYNVTLTCSNDAGESTIIKESYISITSISLNINDNKTNLVSYYPNPTRGILNIDSSEDFRASIYSTNGNLLIQVISSDEINLSELDKGIYVLKIELKDKIIIDKIIKN